jgi:hypothetical protein
MAGQSIAGHKPLHRLSQMADLLRIDRPDLGQRAVGVAVSRWRDERRQIGHEAIVQRATRPSPSLRPGENPSYNV